MSIFKQKTTLPAQVELGFKVWEVGYIEHRDDYTMEAIHAVGLADKIQPDDGRIDQIWSWLEYLYVYQIVMYAAVYFAGKHSSSDVSYVVSNRYAYYLLIELRKEDNATAIKTVEDLEKFQDEVEVILDKSNQSDESADAEFMATLGVMVVIQRVQDKMPELEELAKYLAQNFVWVSSKTLFKDEKISWN